MPRSTFSARPTGTEQSPCSGRSSMIAEDDHCGICHGSRHCRDRASVLAEFQRLLYCMRVAMMIAIASVNSPKGSDGGTQDLARVATRRRQARGASIPLKDPSENPLGKHHQQSLAYTCPTASRPTSATLTVYYLRRTAVSSSCLDVTKTSPRVPLRPTAVATVALPCRAWCHAGV